LDWTTDLPHLEQSLNHLATKTDRLHF